MKNTIVNKEPAKPREILDDLLHWVWSWQIQVQRLVQSTKAQGEGDSALQQRQSFSNASYDEHMLVVAGGNLVRAIRRAGESFSSIRIAEEQAEALRLLRNLYEHRDEQRPSFQDPRTPKVLSGKEFAELFPQGQPWSITYTGNDWLLGGAVGIKAVTDAILPLEKQALELEGELKR